MRVYLATTADELQEFLADGSLDVAEVYAPTPIYSATHPEMDEEEVEYSLSLLAAEDALDFLDDQSGAALVVALEVVEGQLGAFEAERVAIKVNRATVGKLQQRQRFVAQLRQTERTGRHLKHHARCARHRINGVADHLGAQRRKLLAQSPVVHVVQSHPVPYARALNFGRQGIAHLGKCRLQSLQPGKLLGCGVKGNAYNRIHIGRDSNHFLYEYFKRSFNFYQPCR